MAPDLAGDLWKSLTSTVGLISTRHEHGVNIMAAEWTSYVNREPLYVSVALRDTCETQRLIREAQEFSVTLCADTQAALATFVGSFSLREVAKSAAHGLVLGEPAATTTPWVTGGVVALECVLRQAVPLPQYTLFLGEALAAHRGTGRTPLVKHGGLHELGAPLQNTRVTAAAQLLPGDPPQLRIAATGACRPGSPWQLSLRSGAGDVLSLGEQWPGTYGDLLVDLPLPDQAARWRLPDCRILVEYEGSEPGTAFVSCPATAPVG
ncbi:flavin reductase family protein [Streptomyces sp. MST-110588]|nr:flavin reductase family protein [Streptomyces sp. MST-110588]